MAAAARAASTGLPAMRSGAANAQAAWFAAATSLSMVPNAANGNAAVSSGGRTEQAPTTRQRTATGIRMNMGPSTCARREGAYRPEGLRGAAQSGTEAGGEFAIHHRVAVEFPTFLVAHHAE